MCLKPIKLKSGSVVPCNKCPKCIARRVSAWSFRLMQESSVSSSAHFVTLTYGTDSVPIAPNGFLSLRKRDVQLFFKRLRKAHSVPDDLGGVRTIKYYAVGEYGGRTYRPHYHVLLFNADVELVDKAWGLGSVFCGRVSGASVGYTLKYMSKHKKRFRRGVNDDRVPEFGLMSKGLGASYIEKYADWHAADLHGRMFCTTYDGIKLSMPRYFKDKIYWDLERAAVAAVYSIQATDRLLDKIAKQSSRDVYNEQQAIDAAYDKMYLSSFKSIV